MREDDETADWELTAELLGSWELKKKPSLTRLPRWAKLIKYYRSTIVKQIEIKERAILQRIALKLVVTYGTVPRNRNIG